MRDEFCISQFWAPAHGATPVEYGIMDVAIELEPDESVGDTDYYIARCYVHGAKPQKMYEWHEVPKTSPLFDEICAHAKVYRDQQMADLWSEWQSDGASRIGDVVQRELMEG